MNYRIVFRISSMSLILATQCRCRNAELHKKQKSDIAISYPTVSYLDIKLDSNGRLPSNPYILSFEKGSKKVVFCGVNHLRDYSDTNHPMYAAIADKFFETKPDIAINEGGDISKKVYSSKGAALKQDGEIGLTKILSDSLHIKTMDGDPGPAYEFNKLLELFSKAELLAYIGTERFMWSNKGIDSKDSLELAKRYTGFVKDYMMKLGGVELNVAEQQLAFFKQSYQQLLGKPFSLDELEPTNPFDAGSRFQEVGRASKEIRDQYLLHTVDSLLDSHDKVFIVFGGWHLLTCKPGLEYIINRKR